MVEREKPKLKGFIAEFVEFLNEYKVIGLAIAFIIGVAASALVKSFVDNIIMPIITVFVPGGAWRTATAQVGPFIFGWGPFLSDLIYFIIVALVVFIAAKKILKMDKVTKM
ncbi:MAG TPA: MscL family protein [Methanoregulaceae archaeon]|nr:MscL family protein [Methanoregulaceae archaeon]